MQPLVFIIIFFLLHFPLGACNQTNYHINKDDLEKRLDSLVPVLLHQNNVPAVSLAVIRNGTVSFSKAYGMADKEKKTPATSNTCFNIGSVSKSLTAFAIMILAERKLIEIDSPVNNYLKRWQLPPSKFDHNKVTIRRIMSHTAGLSVQGYHGVFKTGDRLPTIEQSLSGYEGSDGALYVMREPGKAMHYSSGGYTLLQLLIEEVTGMPFSEFMQKEIFDPLEMTHTSYHWSVVQSLVATPYNENGTPWSPYQFTEQGSGGVYTTAEDLAKFLCLFVANPRQTNQLLKPETIQLIIRPAEVTNGLYGLGVKLFTVSKADQLISHDGANEGWRANYILQPQKGDGVVLLTNSDLGGRTGAPIFCTVFSFTNVDMSPLCSTVKY